MPHCALTLMHRGNQDRAGNFLRVCTIKLTGKVLVLKSLNLASDEVFDDFQRVPDKLPFTKALSLLQTERERLVRMRAGFNPTGL